MGTIRSIWICPQPSQAMQAVEEAELVAGKGIVGDRYHELAGTFSTENHQPDHELTLVEYENIVEFAEAYQADFPEWATRRNLVTEGIRLNDLVGQEIAIGSARIRFMRLCEPCKHLAKLTDQRILPGLVGKGGIRAAIVRSGRVHQGDRLEVISQPG